MKLQKCICHIWGSSLIFEIETALLQKIFILNLDLIIVCFYSFKTLPYIHKCDIDIRMLTSFCCSASFSWRRFSFLIEKKAMNMELCLNSCSCKQDLKLILLVLSQIINSYSVRNQLLNVSWFYFEYFLIMPCEKD